ncbi:ketoacyl-ACP synthase III [Flavobacteriaceae bacterium]|jgi:3-oxoacyl-[acyl-carrier-protein] synthase-3|nr:ketoacyl-ACP synthase III [Flavobacteriaceae bacterium]MDA9878946.1 ketoacyl-ACP synthase III [Flavobacteriaceae bacterium]MDB2327744.1 ketoacyl-ACP synthase III [Flavobacteriaceae bacterium]
MNIKITGSGSSIPDQIQLNSEFSLNSFYDADGKRISNPNEEIIEKFKAITGIEQRRYIKENETVSDIAVEAAKRAINDAKLDPETLDYIIVAHNVGDIALNTNQVNTLPSLASKVKAGLRIKNPDCVAYDILFGCPGWVEGVIQAKAFIKAGMAKKCLVIGADTLSRVLDQTDRDSMIYADGAGATVIEECDAEGGILSHKTATYTFDGEAEFIFYGPSNQSGKGTKYIKMHGRKVYEFALSNVPAAIQNCLDASGESIEDVKKIFIHQANLKMDDAIIKRLYRLYKKPMPEGVLPMNIQEFGNSSVATVPTLFDLIRKENYKGHQLHPGDLIIFASVGAGMNINAITYRM